ncbi:Mitogen-activated protein kinase kinase kinase [Aphelenchoides besseyi]|nr:Mitogen-activated protein kinase kinase kinase [Aphelenchoides besseyi]
MHQNYVPANMNPLHVDINVGPSSSNGVPPSALNTPYEQVDYREIIFPDFQHIKRLGRGSYGTVVQATFRGKRVACKLVETNLHIHNEASVLHSFKHDNIIKLYATFHGEQSGLILELMEGGSLHDLLHQQKHIQYRASHVLGWAQQVLAALHYLHSREYVHRDLKPSNMLLTNDFITLKLCDFGTAAKLRTSMTNNRGSAPWMAPEVFRGKKYDQKCDVFSVGILLWEMITRRQPFDDWDSHAFTILWQVSEGRRPNLIDNCPSVIMDLIKRCWSAKPNERPDVKELSDTIDILCEIYPNRYEALVDRTTHHQAFAHPIWHNQLPPQVPQRQYHTQNVYPTPPASNSTTITRPPAIPPPPQIRRTHNRTGSHDLNTRASNSDSYYQQPGIYQGQTCDYNPMISRTPSPSPYTPCMQTLNPNSPNAQYGNHNLTIPGDIGIRRSSEPPLSDTESVYSSRSGRKKKNRIKNFFKMP